MARIVSGIALLLLIWLVRFGFNLVTAEPLPVNEPADTEWIAEESHSVEQEIEQGSAVPARGWLAEENHGTLESNPEQLDALIDEFHEAGAVRIWMVGIESLAGKQFSDTIAVELPSEPTIRTRLFAIEADVWGGEGTPDVGQRFLTLALD